ncbi:MAG: chloride channel protein [Methylobacteriaceae bacterium]|nr:chloride channel protein [Methylobacteriaceae bacterium]
MLSSRHLSALLPARIREAVRSRESGLVLAALCIGTASGCIVVAMSGIVQLMHSLFFGLDLSERLSAADAVEWWRALLVPALGGLCLGVISISVVARLRVRFADAIEANALYGGKLSFRASLVIAVQTIVSSGFGASVGLEAGYTQMCAAIASWTGQRLAARRADLRMLVAAGAAGAIGAAFDAPLAGAFYGFEVVLGTYAVSSLVPVAASALMATLVANELTGHISLLSPRIIGSIEGNKFVHTAAIGVICAGISITVMEGVALAETVFTHPRLKTVLRPAAGGLVVGALALVTPQVLGAGHGAMQMDIVISRPIATIAALLVLKCLSSAISLGSGFRGGLFFASLLIGALAGRLYADLSAQIDPIWAIDAGAAAITGMAALGTGVLGAPVTMTVLALETTSEISITVAALIASTISSLIVREAFGYSFATWRFHLRGEVIRGPHDVGWIQELTVGRMMRTDVATAPAELSIGEMRSRFPLGATKQVALLKPDQTYAGLVLTADLYATENDINKSVSALARHAEAYLLPEMNIQRALDAFRRSEADALIVADSTISPRVMGLVSEAHALRRYGEELEKRNQEFIA